MIQFNDGNFNPQVLQATNPVVVDFWDATCGPPCGTTLAMLQSLEPLYTTVTFGTLDTGTNPITTAQYDITIRPTVIIFQGGQPVWRNNGAPTRQQMIDALNALGLVSHPAGDEKGVAKH